MYRLAEVHILPIKYLQTSTLVSICKSQARPKDIVYHKSDGLIPWANPPTAIVPVDASAHLMDMLENITDIPRDTLMVLCEGHSSLQSIVDNLTTTSMASRGVILKLRMAEVSGIMTAESLSFIRPVLAKISASVKFVDTLAAGHSKIYIASLDHKAAYVQLEKILMTMGYLDKNNILERGESHVNGIILKAYINCRDVYYLCSFYVVDFIKCHPYEQLKFMRPDMANQLNGRISKEVSKEVLGYDSPRNKDDIVKVLGYTR